MFSAEYCEIFKKTYFEEHLLNAASVLILLLSSDYLLTGYEQLSYQRTIQSKFINLCFINKRLMYVT